MDKELNQLSAYACASSLPRVGLYREKGLMYYRSQCAKYFFVVISAIRIDRSAQEIQCGENSENSVLTCGGRSAEKRFSPFKHAAVFPGDLQRPRILDESITRARRKTDSGRVHIHNRGRTRGRVHFRNLSKQRHLMASIVTAGSKS